MSGTSKGVDRRLFLAAGAATMAMPMAARAALGDLVYYIGTMGAAGVSTLTYSPAYDQWKLGKADPSVPNASFGVYSPKFKRHYILNEQDAGTVGVYQANSSGKVSKKGEVSTQGKSPCYVSLDATESYLAVANYGSGNIVVYTLDKSGLPTNPVVKQNSGTGKDPERQEGPHAHCVKWSPDQKFIYSTDLGTDEVIAWPFDAATGAVGDKVVAFKCEPGFGPRHLLIHPSGQVAYLVGELANAVVTLRPNADGTFIGTQWTSTLPEGYTDHSQAAHIALNRDGNLLYVSNRGHNSIATFYLDGTGRLGASQITPCGGDWPRFFTVIPGFDRIIIGNQKSGDVTIMKLHSDGTLSGTVTSLKVDQPVFVGSIA